MNQEDLGRKMSRIVAKCWLDEGFKKMLLADPSAVLQAEGVELPAGLSLKAVENSDKVFHLVIPNRPADLSDEDLDKVAGGQNVTINFIPSFARSNPFYIFQPPFPGPDNAIVLKWIQKTSPFPDAGSW